MAKYAVYALVLLILAFAQNANAGLILNHPNYLELGNGLVGFWSFDGKDMSGNTAHDRSGQGNNLSSLQQSPQKTIGKIGQALRFDDSCLNNTVSFDGTGNMTFSMWG